MMNILKVICLVTGLMVIFVVGIVSQFVLLIVNFPFLAMRVAYSNRGRRT